MARSSKQSSFARRLGNRLRRYSRPIAQRLAPAAQPHPVFIVGCARSGSSMVMEAFDRSLWTEPYVQLDPRLFERHLLQDERLQALLPRSRAEAIVCKPMHENQRIPELLKKFPAAKVVWLWRDYGDTINSSVRAWKTMVENLGRVATDPANSGWYGDRITPAGLELVRRHYRPDMTSESAYGLFWVVRHQFYFDFGLASEPRVRIFRYEDLVQNPAQAFAEMFRFAGCSFTPWCAKHVHAKSVQRHDRPTIDPAIERLCQEMTERLETVCPPMGARVPAAATFASTVG